MRTVETYNAAATLVGLEPVTVEPAPGDVVKLIKRVEEKIDALDRARLGLEGIAPPLEDWGQYWGQS